MVDLSFCPSYVVLETGFLLHTEEFENIEKVRIMDKNKRKDRYLFYKRTNNRTFVLLRPFVLRRWTKKILLFSVILLGPL